MDTTTMTIRTTTNHTSPTLADANMTIATLTTTLLIHFLIHIWNIAISTTLTTWIHQRSAQQQPLRTLAPLQVARWDNSLSLQAWLPVLVKPERRTVITQVAAVVGGG
ncbi:hypothetical protein BDQ12DRAFT_729141 [Crucibulum laeve]|uniref:Uncharacterized protein n=1 Tax=Crucibulum laeve TaxID=68775 RepID=A0A5C3LGS4_9AGAR|nr:hypothetical protein BDQ12DRAFT_729141 [Crucibulum laeve]